MSLLLVALLSATSAHASQSIDMRLSMKTNASFQATSASSYRLTGGTSTIALHLAADINGQKQSQDVPPTTQPDNGEATIDILSSTEIQLTGTDGSTKIKMSTKIQKDGSFTVKGEEMKKALNALVHDKVEAIKEKLAGQGKLTISMQAPDMVCKAKARQLSCEYGAVISVRAEE